MDPFVVSGLLVQTFSEVLHFTLDQTVCRASREAGLNRTVVRDGGMGRAVTKPPGQGTVTKPFFDDVIGRAPHTRRP